MLLKTVNRSKNEFALLLLFWICFDSKLRFWCTPGCHSMMTSFHHHPGYFLDRPTHSCRSTFDVPPSPIVHDELAHTR